MRIGLTGGVGCGVSEVARHLGSKGVPIVSGDEMGHLALNTPEVSRPLIERFGQGILDAENLIDRSKLGAIVFADERARRDLNRIIHPTLLDMLAREVRATEAKHGIVVVDAALIYEWGLQGFFHKVIVVDAPLDLRISRTIARDKLTEEQVRQRIAAQMPLEKKVEKADVVISNNGTLEELHSRVDAVWTEMA